MCKAYFGKICSKIWSNYQMIMLQTPTLILRSSQAVYVFRVNMLCNCLILREICPNKELFLVCIFLFSDQKKLRIRTLFIQRNVKKLLAQNRHNQEGLSKRGLGSTWLNVCKLLVILS